MRACLRATKMFSEVVHWFSTKSKKERLFQTTCMLTRDCSAWKKQKGSSMHECMTAVVKRAFYDIHFWGNFTFVHTHPCLTLTQCSFGVTWLFPIPLCHPKEVISQLVWMLHCHLNLSKRLKNICIYHSARVRSRYVWLLHNKHTYLFPFPCFSLLFLQPNLAFF